LTYTLVLFEENNVSVLKIMNVNLRRGGPEGPRGPRGYEDGMDEEMDNSQMSPRPTRRGSSGPWMLVGTIVVVLIILGVVFKDSLFSGKKATPGKIASSDYQAVFLTNGQVYFGALSEAENTYVNLRKIYYLQVTPNLQTQGTVEGGNPPPAQQQLSLVKLGNELHGPVDEMFINREQILFIEDLKDDGRVVQAIKEFEASTAQ